MSYIKLNFENCNYNQCNLLDIAANSSLTIELKFENIISLQSRNSTKEHFINLIKNELSKFKWIITGRVSVELVYYINAIERQETDKIADLDNIAKPLLDSITGENGILIDDSQIGLLTSEWIPREENINENIMLIKIDFINDFTVRKEGLFFVQYYAAMCIPINLIDFTLFELFSALVLIRCRLKQRKLAEHAKQKDLNLDFQFVKASYVFHKSRLNKFSRHTILSLNDFKKTCKEHGITFSSIKSIIKDMKEQKK